MPLCKLLLPSDGAYRAICRTLYTRMCSHLILVVSHCRLCNWAYIARVRLEHIRVVGRKDRSSGAYNRAESIVHLLGLGLLYSLLQHGARCSLVAFVGDGRVGMQVVVVVGGCAYNGALSSYVSVFPPRPASSRVRTTWPSFARSTEGWFGGRTSLVVPITGQDMLMGCCIVDDEKVWGKVAAREQVERGTKAVYMGLLASVRLPLHLVWPS